MVERKYSLIFSVLLASCVVAKEEAPVINNQLAECVEINSVASDKQNSIPVMSFDLNVKSPISACGCKSALGAFSVYALREGYKSYLIGGKIGLAKAGKKYLPLATDKGLVGQGKLEVNFSCALPD